MRVLGGEMEEWGGALRVRLAVLALACGAARGGEYGGGGGGPLYGDAAPAQYGAALDYRAPDASAPLDYKYVEDPPGGTKRPIEDTVDLETWRKPSRNGGRRRENRPDGGAEAEAAPAPKLRRGRGRARPRVRPEAPEEHARRHRQRRPRVRHDDLSPKGRKNRYLDEDLYPFDLGGTTERIVRRKPRDRLFDDHAEPPRSRDPELEEELVSDRKLKGDSVEREETEAEEEGERDQAAPGPHTAVEEEEGEGGGEGGGGAAVGGGEARPVPAFYRDDTNYYDMRRLQDLDSKLPLLLRRTTTRPPTARGEASSATTTDLLALLWTARRRAGGGGPPGAPAPAHSPRGPETTRVGGEPSPSGARGEPDPGARDQAEPGARDEPDPAVSGSPPAPTSVGSTSELSVAERSRLSILKKSQKKDGDKGEPTRKPPVLLQVTGRPPTLVMVEPPTSADPWMRARHVSGDSPRKLEKVKSLMRHKLVAGAKNIQDLTDHWDDMVCDYIDVSLLDAAPRRRAAAALPLLCSALALLA